MPKSNQENLISLMKYEALLGSFRVEDKFKPSNDVDENCRAFLG